MATTNTDINQSFDTQETVNYIRALYNQYLSSQQQLNKYQASLTNLQTQKKAIGEEYVKANADKTIAEANLTNAQVAYSKVGAIADFFNSRIATTQLMVENSYNMAIQAFEATEFVNKMALERVETINTLVNSLNNNGSTDSSQQWSDIFTAAISAASAQGVTAFNAGTQAVISTFAAYVSNQQINARTVNYYKQFAAYEKQLNDIIARLNTELDVINKRYQTLKSKNAALEIQVNEMSKKVQDWEFNVAQNLDEFNAAQQGASYTLASASSAGG